MKLVMCLVFGTSVALLAACASQPAPMAQAPAVAPVVAAPVAVAIVAPSAAVVATPVTAATPATAAATAAAVPVAQTEKVAIPYGYDHSVVNGKDIYCRNDTETGSRTAHRKVCFTQQQLAKMQQHTQDYISDVQRSGAVGIQQCTYAPNCH